MIFIETHRIFSHLWGEGKLVGKSKKVRGHSKTTWTNFCPILTTYLPIVDFRGHLVHYLPIVHVDIEKSTYHLAYLNLTVNTKLYIPSTLNIDFVLWHTQLIVYAVKC